MVTKAVIVAAGYGTRLLPITRCVPKEMLPVGAGPAIDHVVRELVEAGITDLLVISSRRKRALEDWFDRDPELEAVFGRENASDKLARIRPPELRVSFVRQAEMKGTGHALLLARAFAGSDPFVVAYPDDLFGAPNVTRALIDAHRATGGSVLSAQRIADPAELGRYGVIALDGSSVGGVARARRLVEKPAAGEAPSDLVSFGRYLYTPDLFPALEAGLVGHSGGEYHHAFALDRLGAAGRLFAAVVPSRRYDTGTTAAWLETLVDLSLDDPELGPGLERFLKARLGV